MKNDDLQALKALDEMEKLLLPLKNRFDLNSLSPQAYKRVHEIVYMWASTEGYGVERAKQMSQFLPVFQPMVWLCTIPEFLVPPKTMPLHHD